MAPDSTPPIDDDGGGKGVPRERRGGSSTRAANAIRDLIHNRFILPGEQVRQEELALEIGTSRGPIREALQILAAEGLVIHQPNRGYFVGKLTMADMQQIYDVRDLLESKVLRGLGKPSEAVAAQLREINAGIREPGATAKSVIACNVRFHELLMEDSPLSYVKEVLDEVQRKYVAYQTVLLLDSRVWPSVADEHELMIRAREDGDSDGLVELARVHRNAGLIRLSSTLS